MSTERVAELELRTQGARAAYEATNLTEIQPRAATSALRDEARSTRGVAAPPDYQTELQASPKTDDSPVLNW